MIGEFEVAHQDIWGRTGRLMTKSGPLETPVFLPVVDPRHPDLAEDMRKIGVEAIITNSYFAYRMGVEDIHAHLPFRVIMTDSGAFQILKYGEIDANQEEIIRAQEKMGSDIAVILDIPTGINATREEVERSVTVTLKRAHEWLELKPREDIVWVGPVQGGVHLDLVQKSAEEMRKLPFGMHAFGSPVEFLENYEFAPVLRSFILARSLLPMSRPLHFFGVGLPSFFAMAVAAGADVFDSASYVLYARDGRYMTLEGVRRITEITELPCECPVCTEYSYQEIKYDWKLIALHNLHVILGEMRRVREAIRMGRLWELVEMRARSHPGLYEAFNILRNTPHLERGTPVTKERGIFIYGEESSSRPEIRRHITRLGATPVYTETAIILKDPGRPIPKEIFQFAKKVSWKADIFLLSPGLGLIPLEASSVYPLSHAVMPSVYNKKLARRTLGIIQKRVKRIFILDPSLLWLRELTPLPVILSSREKIDDLLEL